MGASRIVTRSAAAAVALSVLGYASFALGASVHHFTSNGGCRGVALNCAIGLEDLGLIDLEETIRFLDDATFQHVGL